MTWHWKQRNETQIDVGCYVNHPMQLVVGLSPIRQVNLYKAANNVGMYLCHTQF